MSTKNIKKITWVGSSKKDLQDCPKGVRSNVGHGLYVAQLGHMCDYAKILKGFGNAGVIEIIVDDGNGTFRGVYTINFNDYVIVLHVFQKKSKKGIETPKRDIDLIRQRLKDAEKIYESLQNEKRKKN